MSNINIMNKQKGFTIVELLVVIVVIAILAAIVTVAYNGITKNAIESSLKSDLKNTATKLGLIYAESSTYPSAIGTNKVQSGENELTYSKVAAGYCIQASSPRISKIFRLTQNGTIEEGECSGGNATPGLARLSAGYYHTCALGSNNQAYCWGDGGNGRLGNGSNPNQPTPVAVSQGAIPAGVTLTSITAGAQHTCALASNNQAYCWGNGYSGQLGNGSAADQSTPVAISQGAIPAGVTLTSITAGAAHTCALASNNQVYCWGYGGNGRLGNGSNPNQPTPVAVSQGAIPAGVTLTSIAPGSDHTCALGSNNQAYCWGYGGFGQLGNGSTASQSTPVAISQGAIPAGVSF